MPPPYQITLALFDGSKFALRYNLSPRVPDFWITPETRTTGLLYLRDGIVLPDDPPIIEPPDPPAQNNQQKATVVTNLQDPLGVTVRALILTTMDYLNQLRTAANPPLPPLTKTQVMRALDTKIKSGEADTPN